MRIDVIGAGAIGLLLSAALARSGAKPRLVAHSDEQASQLRIRGIKLTDTAVDKLLPPEEDGPVFLEVCSWSQFAENIRSSAHSGNDKKGHELHWVLLTVKQKDLTEQLLQTIRASLIPGQSCIAAFQNGIGHEEKLAAVFDSIPIYAAVTTEGARKLSHTEVAHTGVGTTKLGLVQASKRLLPRNGSEPRDAAASLTQLMNEAGLKAERSGRIESVQWDKLLLNAVINPVTALMGIPNGELLQSEYLLHLMRTVLREGLAVGHALGVVTASEEELWERLIQVCEATSINRSSMLQDVEFARETELEWITGGLLRHGERLGLELPVNRSLYCLVKDLEQRRLRHSAIKGEV